MFGADIVASPAGISAAIVDLFTGRGSTAERIGLALERTPIPAFDQVRELPTLGNDLFSLCAFHPPTPATRNRIGSWIWSVLI